MPGAAYIDVNTVAAMSLRQLPKDKLIRFIFPDGTDIVTRHAVATIDTTAALLAKTGQLLEAPCTPTGQAAPAEQAADTAASEVAATLLSMRASRKVCPAYVDIPDLPNAMKSFDTMVYVSLAHTDIEDTVAASRAAARAFLPQPAKLLKMVPTKRAGNKQRAFFVFPFGQKDPLYTSLAFLYATATSKLWEFAQLFTDTFGKHFLENVGIVPFAELVCEMWMCGDTIIPEQTPHMDITTSPALITIFMTLSGNELGTLFFPNQTEDDARSSPTAARWRAATSIFAYNPCTIHAGPSKLVASVGQVGTSGRTVDRISFHFVDLSSLDWQEAVHQHIGRKLDLEDILHVPRATIPSRWLRG